MSGSHVLDRVIYLFEDVDVVSHVEDSRGGVEANSKTRFAATVDGRPLDLASVEYMNSSGLKSFLAWFLTASQSKAHQYTIEVRYDPDRTWQQVSFRPMERLAPKVVRLKNFRSSGMRTSALGWTVTTAAG